MLKKQFHKLRKRICFLRYYSTYFPEIEENNDFKLILTLKPILIQKHILFRTIYRRLTMKTFFARDYNIATGKDITENLARILKDLRAAEGEKTVFFEEGTYYIDSIKCEKYMLYITNTVSDSEFSPDETPHLNAVAFYFGGVENLTVDGNGSVFVIDGKVTNVAIENCENITLKNIELRHAHPDMHELKVVQKSPFSVTFEFDCDTLYEFENGKLHFFGNGYKVRADKDARFASWIGLIREDTPEKIVRTRHPLFSSTKIREEGQRKIRVSYPATFRFKKGDRFYVYDVRRRYAGIFVNKSKNVHFENIKQRFNYSLALVAQDSENITLDSSEFAPESGSARKMASVADFIQLCMCRGKILVKNCNFDGAGDDLLNVHGVHFKITAKNGNELTVRFMHPQTHGFDPFRHGDKIAFIDPDTLLEEGLAVVESSKLINENEICLEVSDASKAVQGFVTENVSACPELEFSGNTSTRIITRGLLITTRGKVVVRSNRFKSTSMSGILLSDDAKSWYESGQCCDVTIESNVFDYCGATPILIKPENSRYAGAVHRNIKILGNDFKAYDGGVCIDAKATDSITVSGNSYGSGKKIRLKSCNDLNIE